MAGKHKRNGVTRQSFIQSLTSMEGATMEQAERVAAYIYDRQPEQREPESPTIFSIPDEVFKASLGHY